MAVYAVGDVQGCDDALEALLGKIRFDPAHDSLWFTGDLVNRGPQSAAVVRFVMGLGARAVTVLGNHDLHLLALAAGRAERKRHDTLTDILTAPDRDELLAWLRARPLLHHDEDLGYTLLHAGALPAWDLPALRRRATEVEAVLRGPGAEEFFAHMYGDQPDAWDESLRGWERLRLIVNVFTRLRYCDAAGRMDLGPKGAPGSQPPRLRPWFQAPGRKSAGLRIVFGHWSTLGVWKRDNVIGLDSGCLWGRTLTAVRLARGHEEFFAVPCRRQWAPGQ